MGKEEKFSDILEWIDYSAHNGIPQKPLEDVQNAGLLIATIYTEYKEENLEFMLAVHNADKMTFREFKEVVQKFVIAEVVNLPSVEQQAIMTDYKSTLQDNTIINSTMQEHFKTSEKTVWKTAMANFKGQGSRFFDGLNNPHKDILSKYIEERKERTIADIANVLSMNIDKDILDEFWKNPENWKIIQKKAEKELEACTNEEEKTALLGQITEMAKAALEQCDDPGKFKEIAKVVLEQYKDDPVKFTETLSNIFKMKVDDLNSIDVLKEMFNDPNVKNKETLFKAAVQYCNDNQKNPEVIKEFRPQKGKNTAKRPLGDIFQQELLKGTPESIKACLDNQTDLTKIIGTKLGAIKLNCIEYALEKNENNPKNLQAIVEWGVENQDKLDKKSKAALEKCNKNAPKVETKVEQSQVQEVTKGNSTRFTFSSLKTEASTKNAAGKEASQSNIPENSAQTATTNVVRPPVNENTINAMNEKLATKTQKSDNPNNGLVVTKKARFERK